MGLASSAVNHEAWVLVHALAAVKTNLAVHALFGLLNGIVKYGRLCPRGASIFCKNAA